MRRKQTKSLREKSCSVRILKTLLIGSLMICFGLVGWVYYYASIPLYFVPTTQSFVIEMGQTGTQVVNMLEQKKLVNHPFWFLFLARMTGNTHHIKAGSYEIQSPLSPYQLLKKLTDGDVQSSRLVIIEGWRWKDIRQALEREPNLRHDIKNMSDAEVIDALSIKEKHVEGMFFPDTYHYVKGGSDLAILKRAYLLMQKNLMQAWEARIADLPLTSPYELLIMASIIEKESSKAADRELISGVFINRLRIGMRLQTDPTVIYGMGDNYKGNIRKIDLITDNVYNTYTRAGLPPSPIAMPGRASLFAAAQPAKTRALYFVAQGDGNSYFSETLLEHNRALNKYLLGRNR
jgi:UPF0755 protein